MKFRRNASNICIEINQNENKKNKLKDTQGLQQIKQYSLCSQLILNFNIKYFLNKMLPIKEKYKTI